MNNIVVGLSGGLGNQLFQFAAGRALSLKLGMHLILDASWFHGQSDRAYSLTPFSIDAQVYFGLPFLPSWANGLESRLSRRYARKRLGSLIYREPHFHFDDNYSLLDRPVYLDGFWQSERYFSSCKEIIASDLMLNTTVSERFNFLAKQIELSDSICIHIRRGDYVTNPIATQMHGLCSLEYVYQGVKLVSKNLMQPHCYIFSDDPKWVSSNLTIDLPFTMVDVAKPHEAHLDLALMSKCKHFVIANSSFSWWGAWLSDNPAKRVVAPKKWFASADKCVDDLIPAGWIKI